MKNRPSKNTGNRTTASSMGLAIYRAVKATGQIGGVRHA